MAGLRRAGRFLFQASGVSSLTPVPLCYLKTERVVFVFVCGRGPSSKFRICQRSLYQNLRFLYNRGWPVSFEVVADCPDFTWRPRNCRSRSDIRHHFVLPSLKLKGLPRVFEPKNCGSRRFLYNRGCVPSPLKLSPSARPRGPAQDCCIRPTEPSKPLYSCPLEPKPPSRA
jgi:hypothetical protein